MTQRADNRYIEQVIGVSSNSQVCQADNRCVNWSVCML